jgi:hypothetical protein
MGSDGPMATLPVTEHQHHRLVAEIDRRRLADLRAGHQHVGDAVWLMGTYQKNRGEVERRGHNQAFSFAVPFARARCMRR